MSEPYRFNDGSIVGVCEHCQKTVYANKPAKERKPEDMKAYVQHLFDEHPDVVFDVMKRGRSEAS